MESNDEEEEEEDESEVVSPGAAAEAPAPIVAPPSVSAGSTDLHTCLICLTDYGSDSPIWTCSCCYVSVHLPCMREWMVENESKQRWSKCPACQTSLPNNMLSYEIGYECWCKKQRWEERHIDRRRRRRRQNEEEVEDENDMEYDDHHEPGERVPAHSCGDICGRERPNGCLHPCEAICHPKRCQPCGHMRVGVKCVGGHQTFEPFPCGQEVPTSCNQPCGQLLECGHHCTAPCHDYTTKDNSNEKDNTKQQQYHPPCNVMVHKSCACGKQKESITVPCSQAVVQCNEICGKLNRCGQHRCERKCHPGGCEGEQVQLVASAWNKGAWMKVQTKQNTGVTTPNANHFPSLASSASSSTSNSLQTSSASSLSSSSLSSSSFLSCGKVCGRMKSCGHICSQPCHDLSKTTPSSSSSPLSQTTACDALQRCYCPITLHCPCGRQTFSLKCYERSGRTPEEESPYGCDQQCRAVSDGNRFFQQMKKLGGQTVTSTRKNQPSTGISASTPLSPSPLLFLPFTQSLLHHFSPSQDQSVEGMFYRKMETTIEKYCVGILKIAEEQEKKKNKNGNVTLTNNKLGTNSSATGTTSSNNLYLPSSLTPSRRLFLSQLALWSHLHYDAEGNFLQKRALSRPTSRSNSKTMSIDNDVNDRKKEQEECKEDEEAKEVKSSNIDGDDENEELTSSLYLPPSKTNILLPSMSPSVAAQLLHDSTRSSAALPPSTIYFADNWPRHLLLRFHFTRDSHSLSNTIQLEGGGGEDTLEAFQRWVEPYRLRTRACILSPSLLHLLFTSESLAFEAYHHFLRSYADTDFLLRGVEVQKPQWSGDERVRLEEATRAEESKHEKELASEARRHTVELHTTLQERAARIRAANPPLSASVLPSQSEVTKKSAIKVVSIGKTAHTKLKVQSQNKFAFLEEEED